MSTDTKMSTGGNKALQGLEPSRLLESPRAWRVSRL